MGYKARRTLSSIGIDRAILERTPTVDGRSREAILDRIEVFFDGVTRPYRRAGEVAISLEFRGRARDNKLDMEALMKRSKLSLEEIQPFMEGIFRLESPDTWAFDKLSQSLGIGAKKLRRIARDANSESAGIIKNDYGCSALFQELRREVRKNPEMHDLSISIGLGARFMRAELGMGRGMVSAQSGISVYYPVFLEHCLLPDEKLEGEELDKMASTLRTTVKALERTGRSIRGQLGLPKERQDADKLVAAVKAFIGNQSDSRKVA